MLAAVLSGMLLCTGASNSFMAETVEDGLFEESIADDAAEAIAQYDAQQEQENKTEDELASNQSMVGDLIEGGSDGADASLPSGLSIAGEVAASRESSAIITVDPSLYPAANFSENAREVYWFCRLELGLNHAAACGVLANVQLESSFRPLALGDGGTSYGICQWHLGRCDALVAFCSSHKLDYNTLEGQLAYLQYELTHGYAGVYRGLLTVEDTEEGAYRAAYIMCVQFEMPNQMEARGMQRGNLARYNYFGMDFAETAEFTLKEKTALYDNADTDSRVLGQLNASDEIKLLSLEGTWAGIEAVRGENRRTGYVPAQMLKHEKETTVLESPSSDDLEEEGETEGTKETAGGSEAVTEEIAEGSEEIEEITEKITEDMKQSAE